MPKGVRDWLTPAAWVAGVGAALLLIFPLGFPNYDTIYALVWGRELAHGHSPDYGAALPPTPHPLADLLGLVTTPLGEGAITVTMVVAYVSIGLIAYLVYYDGITTVTTLSADYGQEELRLGSNTLLTAILIVQFAAFGGALLLGRLAQVWGAKRVIAGSLVVWIGVVGAAYFVQAGAVFQFYALALVLSIVLGGSQALSRSLYSSLVPAGKEAEYFSVYEISSSGSSALGPLLFGLTLQNTGSYREAILSLVVFFIVGLGLLLPLNLRRAVEAAGNVLPASMAGRNEPRPAAEPVI